MKTTTDACEARPFLGQVVRQGLGSSRADNGHQKQQRVHVPSENRSSCLSFTTSGKEVASVASPFLRFFSAPFLPPIGDFSRVVAFHGVLPWSYPNCVS